jgi:hypothetical protein
VDAVLIAPVVLISFDAVAWQGAACAVAAYQMSAGVSVVKEVSWG